MRALITTAERYQAALAGWLPIDSRTEYRMRLDDGSWSAWYELTPTEFDEMFLSSADDTFEFEQRQVPDFPADLLPTHCPDCDGDGAEGYVICHWDAHSWVEPCGTCDGLGYVGGDLGVITEQCRIVPEEPWGLLCSPTTETCERRSALLAEVRATGEPIPVVDERRDVWVKNHQSYVDHVAITEDGAFLYSERPDGWGWHHRPLTEPWAQHLTPGMWVVPVEVTPLDQPIVDQPCRGCVGRGLVCRSPKADEGPDYVDIDHDECGGSGRVPLDAPVGEWTDIDTGDPR